MTNGKPTPVEDQVEKLADDAAKSMGEIGREVNHQAENAKSEMVKALYETAKTLRRETREAGVSDEVQTRVDDVAKGFEKAAGYLKTNSYSEIGEDAVTTVKRYPMQTIAVIFVIGVIIGLLLRGSNSSNER